MISPNVVTERRLLVRLQCLQLAVFTVFCAISLTESYSSTTRFAFNTLKSAHTTQSHTYSATLSSKFISSRSQFICLQSVAQDTNTDADAATDSNGRPPCYYKDFATNRWQPRVDYLDLKVGQELMATVFPKPINMDKLLFAKTGPKIWVDIGAGRFDKKKWHIQTAMLRLQRANKVSVVKKQAQRLSSKAYFTVYVSRIRPENQQIEVVLDQQDIPSSSTKLKSITTLQTGQVVNGTVIDVLDYGILVKVDNINRKHGLLPIRRVGHLFQKYMDGATGLKQKAGFTKNMRVQLVVDEIKSNRDFTLDFTDATYKEQQEAIEQMEESGDSVTEAISSGAVVASPEVSKQSSIATNSKTETKNAAVASADDSSDDDEDEDDEYDDYDEDRDIEDALGLGYY